MKRLLIVALFALTFCFTASAQGLYVDVDAGYGMWSHETENGTGLDTSNIGLALPKIFLQGSCNACQRRNYVIATSSFTSASCYPQRQKIQRLSPC